MRTATTNALVLLVPSEENSYVILRITDFGYLALEYRNGTGETISVSAPLYYVSDARWHSLTILVAESLSLSIDNRVSYSVTLPSQLSRFGNSFLHVGGVGSLTVPLEIQTVPGLVGCVDGLSINSQLFQNNFIDGKCVFECVMGACTSTVCSENGVCSEEPSTNEGIECECNLGYTGTGCAEGKLYCWYACTFSKVFS